MKDFFSQNENFFNVLSGIGTFISSIIGIYTLREVIKQRLSTYKPELILKSFSVYLNKSPLLLEKDESIQYKILNFNEYKKDENDSFNGYNNSCLYKIENFGFGPAKKIKLIWSFDTEKALKTIKNLMPENYYFEEFKPLNYFFLINKLNSDFHFSIINNQKTIQEIDFLTPVNIKDHSHLHEIPKEIINCHFLYYIFKNNYIQSEFKNNIEIESFNTFPKVSLIITYEDINRKKHKIKTVFSISMYPTQIDELINLNKEFAYLNFETN